MLNELNARIAVSLKNLSRAGELTTGRIRTTTQDAVVQIAGAAKARTTSARDTARGAVIAAVQSLQETGEASRENIAVAVEGIVEGVRRIRAQRAETARAQPSHANTWLSQQRGLFAESVREALEGAKDAAGSFSGDVKTHIETAVGDLKLKNAQLLGLTRGAVKQAVKRAIEAGTQLEETVVRITSDATEKALAEGPFIAERVASVTESVLAGAVEAAEEIGADVNQVSKAAAAGISKGLTRAVEKPSDNVSATESRVKDSAIESLNRMRSDAGVRMNLFIETLRTVASRSGKATKDTLTKLADEAGKAASRPSEIAWDAAQTAAQRLKGFNKVVVDKTAEAAERAARAVTAETVELGNRMWEAARGTIAAARNQARRAAHKGRR